MLACSYTQQSKHEKSAIRLLQSDHQRNKYRFKKFITKGLNQQFLNSRRQNYLNSGYNYRRNKLKNITLQNIKIYERICSQKSQYSRNILKKSYQFNLSLSKRISSSKVSRKSSSQSSLRSSARLSQGDKTKNPPKNNKYQIQAKSVENVKKQQLIQIKDIFKQQICSIKPNINLKIRLNRYQFLDKPSLHQGIKTTLPIIHTASIKKQQHSSYNKFRHQKKELTVPYYSKEIFRNKKIDY